MSDRYGRGESGDILEDLNSLKVERQKDAVKKVISAMTIGRDVGKLFPQVVKCIATNDLELKKLVYLYIINYARIKPVETLLAVNSFKKDASDMNNNPLTRALAVRTMGCLGVEQIMQFLCDPLKDALMDKDPYVRKTAALCVAKIYDINSQLVEEQFCFVDLLQRLIEEEGNAMVIANCLAALIEISTTKGEDIIKMNWRKTRHLMNALHENNEWCQIYLLEGISKYSPQGQDEILEVIERVLPFISHSNSGVILSAIKILIKTLDLVESAETVRSVCKKITPSLVTLLSSEPEIQFVALKNINILIQKRPIIFEKDIKMFFCNFTEPIYNKMEKLEILYKLVTMNNVDLVLNELREYAGEVDVQFVKRSVRLVGQLAIKLEKAAQRCVELLVELVKTQVSFVIQEAIIALRDVFRRYPNTFEGAMAIVNENLKTLNDAEAKAALIWIIGEYADRIDGAEAQLVRFLDNLKEEPYNVQLQILNSAVKTFLKTQTEESYNILNQVFEFTSKEADNPDLRERGFIYWRLMAIDPNLAAQIVISEKPRISEDVSAFDPTLLDILMNNLGTLATIYVKPPELFVKKTKKINIGEEEETDYEENAINLNEQEVEVENKNRRKTNKQEEDSEYQADNRTFHETDQNTKINVGNSGSSGINLLDINDILGGGPSPNTNNNKVSKPVTGNSLEMMNIFESNSGMNNLLDNFSSISLNTKKPSVIPKQLVLNEMTPGFTYKRTGLSIEAAFQREVNGSLSLIMTFNNKTNDYIKDFEIQFNRNYFGLSANSGVLKNLALQPGGSDTRNVEVFVAQPDSTKVPSYDPPCIIQTAIRCTLDEFYFTVPIMFCVLFKPQNQKMSFDEYQRLWINIQTPKDMFLTLNSINPKYQDIDSLITRLEANHIYLIQRLDNNGATQLLFHSIITNDQFALITVAINPQMNVYNLVTKTESNYLISHVLHSLKFLLLNDC